MGLFLLAYLPQFVPAHAQVAPAMALLATVYLALGAVWLAFLIVVIHLVRRKLSRRVGGADAFLRLTEILLGLVFVAFAARLALGR